MIQHFNPDLEPGLYQHGRYFLSSVELIRWWEEVHLFCMALCKDEREPCKSYKQVLFKAREIKAIKKS